MQTKTQARTRTPSHPIYLNEGLSSKKTALIIVTVIGCIAILWPKVFYPMLFGSPPAPIKTNMKEPLRGAGGCCGVTLNGEYFLNETSMEIGPKMYRKKLNLYSGEISLRQERPAHLHPESIYQAMRERGRAIPASMPTVPIMDRKGSPSNPPPRIVEGRPGPIPGMRPPMGAGALHQPQAKGNSMGFIMPLYTVGIIVFFGYTIMKLVFKKPTPNAPYGPAPSDPNFRKEVFGQENGRHVEDLHGTKLVVTAIQGLIDAADEQLKLQEHKKATTDLSQDTNESTTPAQQKDDPISTHHTDHITTNGHTQSSATNTVDEHEHVERPQTQAADRIEEIGNELRQRQKRRDGSSDRSVAVLGMEVTASCEGGQKWTGRPPTPVFYTHYEHSKDDDDMPAPQSIYLEGTLAHESQILVTDSETKTEQVYDDELNGSSEEPAVVLSSKMTLSLINLDSNELLDNAKKSPNDIESPLADDIEIIGHDEK